MKNNFFVIGNGFDLGHDMSTSYIEFKNWLIDKYPKSQDTDNFTVPDMVLSPDGGVSIDDEDLASFLVYCINENAGES